MTFAATANAAATQGRAEAVAAVGTVDPDDITNIGDLDLANPPEIEGAIHQRVDAAGDGSATVNNSGALSVTTAITQDGGEAQANGILIVGNGTGIAPAAGDVVTITNNGGTITARESDDGGATFRPGMAIDVAAAPNDAVINLLGDGAINGNIDIRADDVILVQDGETSLDGIVNPECMPAGGPTALTFDDPALSACGQGTLTINEGGTLFLLDGTDSVFDGEGPSYVFVDVFNVGDNGTLALELDRADAGVQPIGSYPQVFAEVANLDGTLDARIGSIAANGLFPDTLFFNNVIDANQRNGQFDQCLVNGVDVDAAALIEFGCIYDGQNNVDLGLTRIAFNAVEGLPATRRQSARRSRTSTRPTWTDPLPAWSRSCSRSTMLTCSMLSIS